MELHPILECDSCAPPLNMWHVLSALGDAPSMRVGHTATHVRHRGEVRGKVFVIGGANPDSAYGDVYILDLDTLTWDRIDIPDEPVCRKKGGDAAVWLRPRYEHAAFVPVSQPDEIFVLAGADKSGNVDDDGGHGNGVAVQAFNMSTHTWRTVTAAAGVAPSARTHHSSAAIGDCCYLFSGGRGGAEAVGDWRVHRFDAVSRTWSALDARGEPPVPRHGHAFIAADGVVYVHGGMAGPKLYDDLYAIDVTAALPSWQSIGHRKLRRPSPRAAHGAVARGRHLYVFGGLGSSGAALDDLWQFDTASNAWTEVKGTSPPPAPRLDFACCIVPWVVESSSLVTQSGAGAADAPSSEFAALAVKTEAGSDQHEQSQGAAGETSADMSGQVNLLLFINGGMDTQGEIFDDSLVFRLEIS